MVSLGKRNLTKEEEEEGMFTDREQPEMGTDVVEWRRGSQGTAESGEVMGGTMATTTGNTGCRFESR